MLPLMVIAFACWLASAIWHLTQVLQFFQQHEYSNVRFLRWSMRKWKSVTWPVELFAVPVLLISFVALGSVTLDLLGAVALVLTVGCLAASFFISRKHRAKTIKRLVYTARVKRLLAVAILLTLGAAFIAHGIVYGFALESWTIRELRRPQFELWLLLLIVIGQLAPLTAVCANLLLFPLEALIRERYVWSARRKIRSLRPIVIGITGSFGKTSTKEILSHLLSAKYGVLKTPKSYNTLMGICKVIREDLKPEHQYFVVEMGAYKPGEIAKLCRLVEPQMGILTAIGPQHLDRFGTLEKIVKAKNELIESLPGTGIAVFNGDDPWCLRLSQSTAVKVRKYGLSSTNDDLDLRASNVEIDCNGTRFEITYGTEGPVSSRTALLGRHNVSNILGAAAVALECGISLREVVQSLVLLPPVEHRLQLISGPNGITYIDDAYNSNPRGAALALEVLATFNGRRFLVTPGFVELGDIESAENEQLGRNAAAACDYVFLVGQEQRIGSILTGLQSKSFDANCVFVVGTLAEAREILKGMVRAGDVILFENDLPDIY
jgi:UDP-N-acetylmuramoyl-tripeptide--D-alanyl-D-alanine ligase